MYPHVFIIPFNFKAIGSLLNLVFKSLDLLEKKYFTALANYRLIKLCSNKPVTAYEYN